MFKTIQQRRAVVRSYLRWIELRRSNPRDFGHIPWQQFLLVGPDEVDEMIRNSPPDLIAEIKQHHYPRTEEEWRDGIFLVGGSYQCSVEEYSAALKQTYREAVELLQRYFAEHDETPPA